MQRRNSWGTWCSFRSGPGEPDASLSSYNSSTLVCRDNLLYFMTGLCLHLIRDAVFSAHSAVVLPLCMYDANLAVCCILEASSPLVLHGEKSAMPVLVTNKAKDLLAQSRSRRRSFVARELYAEERRNGAGQDGVCKHSSSGTHCL